MYQAFFHKLNEIEDIDYLPEGYEEFKEYVLLTEYGQKRHLYEFAMPSKLKAKIDFIKQLADEMGKDAKTLFQLFLNPKVFEFFNKIKWSMGHLFDLVKDGYKAYKEIRQAVKEYLAKNKVVHWTTEKLKDLDEFLNQHPNLKRIGGLVIAGLLIYLWTQISFTGDLDADFDLSLVFSALQGHLGFADVFSGPNGIELLLLLVTNLMGLSFPFPGAQSVQFVFAVVYTLGKKYLPKFFKHGRMTEGTIDELKEFSVYDFRKQSSPFTRKWRRERDKLRGKESKTAVVVNVTKRKDDLDIDFLTLPTHADHAEEVPSVKQYPPQFKGTNSYRITIRVVDFFKWKTKPFSEMTAMDLKEIFQAADVKFHNTSPAYFLQGYMYHASQLNAAIYPTDVFPTVWNSRVGNNVGMDKHLLGLVNGFNAYIPDILKQIKAKVKRSKYYQS